MQNDVERHARAERRLKKKRIMEKDIGTSNPFCVDKTGENAGENAGDNTGENAGDNAGEGRVESECTYESCKNKIASLNMECNALREENLRLRESIKSMSLDENSFEHNDEKVRIMTGLSCYEKLMVLFSFVSPFLKQHSSLTCFQQLIMTLLRMRLNLPLGFLGYMFDIHCSTASRIFNNTISVLYDKFVPPCVFWPDRQELRESLPMSFRRAFKSCACIIDCFEIFIETPGTLRAKAQTYSQYKHHHTMKYLIGITPAGSVSFISRGWGGRTSDKMITENSGFLNNILPGDTILADRGFDVGDTLGLYNAKLKIPAFTKGKKQLCPADIESTRGLASVRIHVERVIGVVRQKYMILQSTVSHPLCVAPAKGEPMPLDKIVSICCALTNICPPVVPSD